VETRSFRSGLVARFGDALPVRVARRMIAIGGYDRALALAAQAFVAVVPMLLVLAAVLPASVRAPAGSAVVAGLGMSGSAAAAVTELAARPPPMQPITIVGAVLLVVSVLGFTRSLQRTYLAAWELTPAGIRGLGHGLYAAAALVAEFTLIALLGPLLTRLVGVLPLGILTHALVATVLWWPVQRLLLGGRVGWAALLPGAAMTGLGQAVLVGGYGLYMPLLISRDATRYGIFGIAVAIVSWLVVLGVLLVASALFGAECARASTPTPETS